MTFRTLSSRLGARLIGPVLGAALLMAAPMIAATSAQAQRESPQMQREPGARHTQGGSPQTQRGPVAPQAQRGPAQGQVSAAADFRTALQPHGRWQQHSRWGEVWAPANRPRNWRPYTVGHWVYTDDWGWYWIADDTEASWGWVTYHYGRWIFDPESGWVWVPGREWSPAWVQWRRGAQYAGWAALPPEEIIVEYRDQPDVWIFVRARDLIAPRIVAVLLPFAQQRVFIRETVIVNQAVLIRDRGPAFAVNPGIAPGIVAAMAGRPLPAFEVRPRILAGTAQIPGAVQVRAQDLRAGNMRGEATVRQSQNMIRPAGNVPKAQPLAAGEHGRLGDNPPRAARGAAPATTGQAPGTREQPQQQGRQQQQAPAQPPQQQGQQRRPSAQPPQQQGQQVQPPAQRQQQMPQGRAAQPQQRPSTEGRGAAQPQRQPQAERRAIEPQRQAQPQRPEPTQPRATRPEPSAPRAARPQPSAPGATEGRAAVAPRAAAPQRPAQSQPSATVGRGGGGPPQAAPQPRGPTSGPAPHAAPQPRGPAGGTEGRGGPPGR